MDRSKRLIDWELRPRSPFAVRTCAGQMLSHPGACYNHFLRAKTSQYDEQSVL